MSAESARERATRAQRLAADPAKSAWVSANAGSGKTRVLTNRVARHLLDGCAPSKILCLTYTKAAAAEMSKRLFEKLGQWSVRPDKDLSADLYDLTGESLGAADLARARRLFAAALETPGGLQIQTIHAFCQRILKRFPAEAGVAPDFEILDDTAQVSLADMAKRQVVAACATDPSLASAVEYLLTEHSDWTLEAIAADGLRQRHRMAAFFGRNPSSGDWNVALGAVLGLADNETPKELDRNLASVPEDLAADLAAAARIMSGSKNKTDVERAPAITGYLKGRADPAALERYQGVFLTAENAVRKNIATASLVKLHPAIDSPLRAEAERLVDLLERRKAAVTRDRTIAALTYAKAVTDRYAGLKAARRLLDYDDLIEATFRLLSDDQRAWVHFKLDGGIDHVLIDEAQDTSPEQWQIVERLVTEFFVHGDKADRLRTVFAVGDKKQSIFSFQGADPNMFEAMRVRLSDAAAAADHAWESLELDVSFRSAPQVLLAVDETFSHDGARISLVGGVGAVSHIPEKAQLPGLVELWPPIVAPDRENAEPWYLPVDYRSETEPEAILAERIADAVSGWIADGQWLDCESRQVGPGDILILVRDRGALFYGLIKSLKQRGLDVAGMDRMRLREEMAFLDLEALLRFAVLPEDDLALAEVLKGPLFQLTDDDLIAFAPARSASLWRALQSWNDGRRDAIAGRLRRLSILARQARPFAVLQACLAEGGRAALRAVLGAESDDVVEEVLSLSLAYEREEAPTVQGFLAWMEKSAGVVKRDMEQAGDKIRVMTVHGSKGLEAPIVILPQTHLKKRPQSGGPWLYDNHSGVWIWPGRADDNDVVTAALKDDLAGRDSEELHRLLYVGMTRARERLYVCGITTKRDRPDESWHGLARRALGTLGAPFEPFPGEIGLRLGNPPKTGPRTERQRPAEAALPDWIERNAAEEMQPLRRTPSGMTAAEEGKILAPSPLGPPEGVARGRHIHRLLELLPLLSPDGRRDAAWRSSRRAFPHAPDTWIETLVREVLAVLSSPTFAPVFGPGSRAEMAIAGVIQLPGGTHLSISGQIDRLLIGPDTVLAVDFKTGRPPKDQEAPEAYVAQMAAYRLLLSQVYPSHKIETALLWTALPALVPVAAALLDVTGITEPRGTGPAPPP